MINWKMAAAAAAFASLAPFAAMAQSTDPAPGTNSLTAPNSDAGTSTTAPSGTGTSTGEAGVASPAGNPSDKTTDQNQQPGMSVDNPTDPAAGSNPDARAPTSPAGTGSSSP